MKHPGDLQNLQELADYLKACIALGDKETWPRIASWIIGIMCTNEHFDEWNDEELYPEFCEIINIAWEMEVPEVYGLLESDCARLKELVHQFAEKVKNKNQ